MPIFNGREIKVSGLLVSNISLCSTIYLYLILEINVLVFFFYPLKRIAYEQEKPLTKRLQGKYQLPTSEVSNQDVSFYLSFHFCRLKSGTSTQGTPEGLHG